MSGKAGGSGIHRIDCRCRECRRVTLPPRSPFRRQRSFVRTWALLIGASLAAWGCLIAGACRALSSFTTR